MEASCQCQELYALAKQEAEKHKCFTISTSAVLDTWERMRLFFFKGNDLHIGKCTSPTPPHHQPAWPCYRAFPCSHVLQETKHWPRYDSITGLSFWGKIIPFYQPLLNNHHCTLRCSLLLCCHRAEADALHWSGTTHYRKTRLNLLLSSSLISSSWHPSPPLRPPEAPNKADWAALSPSPAPPLPSLGHLPGELGTTPHHQWVGAGTCAALKGNTPNQPSFLKTIGDLFKDAPTSAVPSRHKAWALGLRPQG